jgi:two-component system response regulator FlrC
MDLGLQAKLLRVLQEREVERLGGSKAIPLDVRVLGTTNREMRREVAEGRFREDLYYRLNVFPLHLPPLRERPKDIIPLTRFLLRRHTQGTGKNIPQLTAAAEEKLLSHRWPGNVRELDNVTQRALILQVNNTIDASQILFETAAIPEKNTYAPTPAIVPSAESAPADVSDIGLLGENLKSREHKLVVDALRSTHGNRKQAAEKLGISERTLRYKLARMREDGVAVPPAWGG